MKDKDRIKEKIRLLLNLANNEAATPGEVSAAMSKANKLMHDYMLSIEDIDEAKEEFTCESCKYHWTHRSSICRKMEGAIAKAFDCESFYNKYYKTTTVFGVKLDIDTVVYMYNLCYEALNKGYREYTKSLDYKINLMTYSKSTLKNDFIKGFCLEVISTAISIIKEKEQEAETQSVQTSTAIIVLKDQLVKDEFAKMKELNGLDIKASKGRVRQASSDAITSGRAEGRKLSLRKTVEEQKKQIGVIS